MVTADEKKEMKACILQLSLSTTVYDPGASVPQINRLLEGYDTKEIKRVMNEIDAENEWAIFRSNYLDIADSGKARARLLKLRNSVY